MTVQTLREVQAAFARGVLDPGAAPAALNGIASGGIAAERRLGIYRNNVLVSLQRLLEGAFPASRRLLGAERFREVALAFIRSRPPEQPRLAMYGTGFPAFLDQVGIAARVPHLPDVARLEWARDEAYYAADAPPLTASALSGVPVARYPELRFELHPSLRLIRSHGPVHTLWRAGLESGDGETSKRGPEQVLVVRPDMTVVTRPIAAPDLVLVQALGNGQTLADAAARAHAAEPGFDLERALALHLAGGSFAGCG
jgi:Putative DNA-binding domain